MNNRERWLTAGVVGGKYVLGTGLGVVIFGNSNFITGFEYT